MKYLLLSLLILVMGVGCNDKKRTPDLLPSVKKQEPLWLCQNIDSLPSCDILTPPNIEIIRVGNSYTATYTSRDGTVWNKTNCCGLEFNYTGGFQYFIDSCSLKEDLRDFIKIQMVKTISDIKSIQ